jgi:hypothetical protein
VCNRIIDIYNNNPCWNGLYKGDKHYCFEHIPKQSNNFCQSPKSVEQTSA